MNEHRIIVVPLSRLIRQHREQLFGRLTAMDYKLFMGYRLC